MRLLAFKLLVPIIPGRRRCLFSLEDESIFIVAFDRWLVVRVSVGCPLTVDGSPFPSLRLPAAWSKGSGNLDPNMIDSGKRKKVCEKEKDLKCIEPSFLNSAESMHRGTVFIWKPWTSSMPSSWSKKFNGAALLLGLTLIHTVIDSI